MYDAIYEFAALDQYELAVDIATGSGQAIAPLAARFDKVIGIDSSSNQLVNAPHLPNVEYKVADAHSTSLADKSADLVLVAQALHWFDRPRFYQEVARILKPHGAFAAVTYDAGIINGPDSRATQVYHDLVHHKLGPFWDSPIAHVVNQYTAIESPESHFYEVKRIQMDLITEEPVEKVVGNVASWSAYAKYQKQHPEDGQQLLSQFTADLLAAVGAENVTAPVSVTRKLTVLLAKHPKQQGC